MTFDQKADFGYQFWPLHIKEKQGKGDIFAMSRAAFAVGRNQARPGLLGGGGHVPRAREQLIVGPSKTNRNILLGGNRRRAGTRGAQEEAWLNQVGPPKRCFWARQ